MKMISCKDITELASRAQDAELPLRTRVAFRVHLLICSVCSRYVAHLRFLRRAMTIYRDRYQYVATESLSSEQRSKIRDGVLREIDRE